MIKVPIEPTFNQFIKEFGGELVKDRIGHPPVGENADYFFEAQGIIAELKCLEEDKREDATLQAKIQKLIDGWMDDGTIPRVYGAAVRIRSDQLPEGCKRKLLEIYRRPIQRRLLKANSQIKSTAKILNLSKYFGLLLVVNDGNFALQSDAILYLIWRSLGNDFRSITNLVYLTVNMPADSPFSEKPTLVWASMRRSNAAAIPEEFMRDLRNGWFAYFEKVVGEKVEPISLDGNNLHLIRY